MLSNFFKVSIRNLVRNKLYSLINILGLSIGLACSILIFLYVLDEISYDKFHSKSEQIYRLGIDVKMQGTELKAYVTGASVGRTMVSELPEVLNSTRVALSQLSDSESIIEIDNKKFIEEGIYYVDSTFFEIFDINVLYGKADKYLTTPYTIILTESTANKYFGSTDVVGRSLNMQNQEYIIQAVIEDCPSNSHLAYQILVSFISLPDANSETWMTNDFSYTYVLLDPNCDPELVRGKMENIALKYIGKEIDQVFGVTVDEYSKGGNSYNYLLQSLTDIHLKSHTDFEITPNSDIVYVYIFSIVGLFILLIAIINFMNLTTARSSSRAKEVGIRKVVGAFRKSLFNQFLFESVVMSMISLIVAMVIIESILPVFNIFSSKQLTIGYFSSFYVVPSLLLMGIGVGVISGLYSASYLSASKILNVLKGKLLSNPKKNHFRSFLVIFQFSISIVLFIGTIIIYSQLDLIKNKDVGFEKKNIVVINKANILGNSTDAFKQELKLNPLIENVALSSSLPAKMFGGIPINVPGENSTKPFVPRTMSVDLDFAETFNLKMKEGRFFSEEFRTDTFGIVLNEAAVKEFGLEEPVAGKRLVTTFYGNVLDWKILGVVKDFNYQSLYQDVGSLVLISPRFRGVNLMSIKLKTEVTSEILDYIKEKWEGFIQDTPFDYYMLEADYNNLHQQEFKTGEIFTVFSFLAIFIACLGLFGLASFIAEQKTKEIGVRKALGSSVFNIVKLLLVQFTKWVVWANLIAWPIGYFLMKKWLSNFAYRVNIEWWVFVVSAFLALLIAIITVSFQAVKAASNNPVNSLRYE